MPFGRNMNEIITQIIRYISDPINILDIFILLYATLTIVTFITGLLCDKSSDMIMSDDPESISMLHNSSLPLHYTRITLL